MQEFENPAFLAQAQADAERFVVASGPIARAHFRTSLDIVKKADLSPVTIADRAIEAELRRLIGEAYPRHAIFGEELGQEDRGQFTWVIDPIDGTKSFITGIPLFGTLLALAWAGKPLIGVIDMPAMAERWVGGPDGTTLDGAPAHVSACTRLEEARFCATTPDMFAGAERDILERVSRATPFRRFGGDCYLYGLLASGHVDLILEAQLKPYDFMATVPVVEGAGGRITDWRGEPLTIKSDGRALAAATPELHAAALKLIG
jgi:inositol-phosphate phosphatase/L-galactose 1-phosphate phosphatase/histidinol-phosphatase